MMDLQLSTGIAPSLTMPLDAPARPERPSAGGNQPTNASRGDLFASSPTTVAERADVVAARYHQSFGTPSPVAKPPVVVEESTLLSRMSDRGIGFGTGGIQIELPTGAWDTTLTIKPDKIDLQTELRF